jgi:hypothetical protein
VRINPITKRMNRSLRRFFLPAISACIVVAVRLSGADTPTPVPATAAAAVNPAPLPVAPVAPKIMPLQLPKALEGVITQEEFEAYIKFQQGLRENPEIKALGDQIRAKRAEMLDLQKKAQAAAQAELEAHPDIKAIQDKIKAHNTKPATAPGVAPAPRTAPMTAAPAPVTPTPVAK